MMPTKAPASFPRYARQLRDFTVRRWAGAEVTCLGELLCGANGCSAAATHECLARYNRGKKLQIEQIGSILRCEKHATKWAERKGVAEVTR